MLPLIGAPPFQPPEDVQELAFVLDHVSVDVCPAVMTVGLAVIRTVGELAAATLTVALLFVVPPAPVQDSVKVVVADGETEALALSALPPFQPPEAVQEAASALDQLSVEDWPAVMAAGVAVIKTVGLRTSAILRTMLLLVDPPAPVHESV